jgi:hypothetical protein
MKGRKARANTDTFMYDLDAGFQRRLLGSPADPKGHVPKMLANLKAKNIDTLSAFSDLVREKWPKENIDEFDTHKNELTLKNPELVLSLFEIFSHFDTENKATDRAIMKAFSAAGLNHKNPIDWRLLLEAFSWAHFGEQGKPGRNIDWTDEKYCELLRDVHRIKKEHAIIKDAPALRKLLQLKGAKYCTESRTKRNHIISADRLKKALAEARNPRINGRMRKIVFDQVSERLDAATKANKPLSEKESKALLKRLSRLEADRIGSSPAPE